MSTVSSHHAPAAGAGPTGQARPAPHLAWWRRVPGVLWAAAGLGVLSVFWTPLRVGTLSLSMMANTGFCALSVLALALLLRRPAAAFLVVVALAVVQTSVWSWNPVWAGSINMVVLAAGYHLGRRAQPRLALPLATVLAVLASVANVGASLHAFHVQEATIGAPHMTSDWTVVRGLLPGAVYAVVQDFLVPVVVGIVVRRQGDELDRTRALLAERDAEVRHLVERAVHDDRERMAHELHDLAAHHSTAVLVNAKAAKAVRDARPELVPAIIDDIVDQSQQAQSSLRQMVQLLHDAEEPTSLSPQPSLGEIPLLVEGARRLNPDVEADLQPADVSPSVALAAYRLVQESLTNAHRHAPGAPITVFVGPVDDVLQVEVTTGRSRRAPLGVHGTGTGIQGMAARVHALGGWFEAGPHGRGWRVLAEIPMEAR